MEDCVDKTIKQVLKYVYILLDLNNKDARIARKTWISAKEKMKENKKNMRGITLEITTWKVKGEKTGIHYKFRLSPN